jgi:hypothetical protein
MIFLAYLAIFGWSLTILFLFNQYSPQRAVIISFVVGWMFLPFLTVSLPFIPDYDRSSSISYAVLIGIFLFDPGRFGKFQFKWIDLPMLIWCTCHIPTSLVNGLGLYDGVNSALGIMMQWGVPYFIGRLYLGDFIGLKRMAIAVLAGTIVYAPFCLIESRLSLCFHLIVYGFQLPTQTYMYSVRLGGYRPSVFMTSGLMLSLWILLGALLAVVLLRTGVLQRLWGVPLTAICGFLLFTFILIRSTGAYTLFAVSLVVIFTAKWLRTAALYWAIIIAIVLYLYTGAAGNFPREQIVGAMQTVFSAERVQSMDFRFENEEALSAKAREKALFGWGGYGRSRIYDDYGNSISATDSLWIIAYGVNGIIGIASVFAALMLPLIAFAIRFPARLWGHPIVAPAATLAVFILMYTYDCTANAMINPVYAVVLGGIAGVSINKNPLVEN